MKKSLFLSGLGIIIGLLILSCSQEENSIQNNSNQIIELRGGGDGLLDLLGTSCVPGSIVFPGICNDTIFTDTVNVSIAQFPGCNFTVIYHRFECELSGLLDVTVGDFQILDHDCQEFSDDILNPYVQSIWTDYIIDFEIAVWDEIETQLINQYFDDEDDYNCGQGGYWNINYIRSSCYNYVTTYIQEGPYIEEGLGISTKISCGSQCCERHTRICRNPDGTLNITKYDATNPFAIDCSDDAFLMDPPIRIGKPIWQSGCRVTCPE